MKNAYIRYLGMACALVAGLGQNASAQTEPCAYNTPAPTCATGAAEGFTTLKAFAAPSAHGGAIEFSYILSKDSDYLFTLCQADGSPLTTRFTILDAYHLPLFSNYDKHNKTLRPRVAFYSQATGVVHIKLEADAKQDGKCAMLVLGFRAL